MAAYFIADASVKNTEALKIFRARAASSVSSYGGQYLVRAALIEPGEGTWKPDALAEYASALLARDAAISRRFILVDGVG